MKHPLIKRLSLALLALMLLAALLVLPASASGRLDSPGPTKQEIQQKWQEVTTAATIYAEEPSVTAPYAAGSLTDDYLQSGLTYLNFVRFVANLPAVQMNATLNEDAQYGSVVMAANDTMSHYPEQPADMDDDFYNRGYDATSSSNICSGSGHDPLSCLRISIQAYMDDDGASNLSRVGHRRWLLNPTLLNVGFGFAQSTSGGWYTATKVFDRSGTSFDYDFISWPAAGNFPTNLFETTVPWSITLNPSKYKTPDASQVQITITRDADGRTWHFDGSTGAAESNTTAFMVVDTGGYGVSNCIIFHPGSRNIDGYDGIFTVDVSGIYDSNGNAATLHYQVDFFDINGNFCDHSYNAVITDPTCTADGYTTYTCTACGDSYTGDAVSALGHSYGQWTTETAPTCTQNGIEYAACSRCGDRQERTIAPTGHTEVPGTETPATCTESGLTAGTSCAVCNETLSEPETIPALGHDFGEWVTGTPATCTEGGTEYAACSRCDAQDQRTTEPLGHTEATADGTPATCTASGRTGGTYCTVCNETLSEPETIPALGHDFGEWVTGTPATCTEGGTEYAACSRCDAQDQRTTEPLGHRYENGICTGCGIASPVVQPTAPEITSCYSRVQTSVKVTWTVVEEASGYELWRSTTPDDADSWTRVKTMTDPAAHIYTNQGLTIGQTYYYKVRAFTVDAAGSRTYSDFSAIDYMPASVVFDAPYSNGTTRIRLRWQAVDGSHGYQIWRQNADGSWRIVKTLGDRGNELTNNQGSATAYSNAGLEPGERYTYKMRAFMIRDGKKVFGAYSDEVTVAVMPTSPVVAGASPRAGRAQLTWETVNGAAGYQIWMAESEDGEYKIVKSITDGTTAYTKYDLTSGKTYYFKVRAYVEQDGRKTFGAFSDTVGVTVQ